MELPSDDKIIAAVRDWGNSAMTYVVRNRLDFAGYRVETPWVLRQLKRLEKAGRVHRAKTSYAVQICWSATPKPGAPAAAFGTSGKGWCEQCEALVNRDTAAACRDLHCKMKVAA